MPDNSETLEFFDLRLTAPRLTAPKLLPTPRAFDHSRKSSSTSDDRSFAPWLFLNSGRHFFVSEAFSNLVSSYNSYPVSFSGGRGCQFSSRMFYVHHL